MVLRDVQNVSHLIYIRGLEYYFGLIREGVNAQEIQLLSARKGENTTDV